MVDATSNGEMHRLLSGADETTKRRVREIRARLEARLGERIAPADLERALWLAAGREPDALRDRLQERGQEVSGGEVARATDRIERAFSRDVDGS